jgi:excisionase family DNA binding protein
MFTRKMQDSQISQVRLLTVQEVAEWAKVSTKTVYRWISDNKIPAIRFGIRTYRIAERDLIDYLENSGYYFLIE